MDWNRTHSSRKSFLSAKIDTGADNSSLNITDPLEFLKGEQAWIRFSILLEKDEVVTLEKPIVRFAHIKRKGAPRQKRAVVLFNLCLGTMYKKDVQVNLANRTGFKCPMLIGRSFPKWTAIVDPDLTYSQRPLCSTLLPDWIYAIFSAEIYWSHGGPKTPIEIGVGDSCNSNLEPIIQCLKEVAIQHPQV